MTRFLQKTCGSFLAALSLASTVAQAAAPVLELTPSELPDLLAKHPSVVVQFTSSDPRCTYCVSADTSFDASAAHRYSQPVVFARVQWPAPWSKIPAFAAPIKITGIPDHKFFKNGKEVDAIAGIIKNSVLLNKAVEAFALRKPTSEGTMVVVPSPAVVDVKADTLLPFLAKHERVVLQLVSSDVNCEFCNSSELAFNEAAAKTTDKTIVFARVQWGKPWNKVPDYGNLIKIIGMPKQVVFLKGQNIGAVEGFVPDALKFQQDILGLYAKPALPVVEISPTAPSPVSADITAQEQTAVRMLLRFSAYSDAASRCITPKSTLNNELVKTIEELSKTHAKSLDLAARLPAKFKTSQDYSRYTKWQEEEKTAFKSWHENTLGIPASKAAEPDNCAKLIKNAKALMETKFVLN